MVVTAMAARCGLHGSNCGDDDLAQRIGVSLNLLRCSHDRHKHGYIRKLDAIRFMMGPP
jgi:hypothetical protein